MTRGERSALLEGGLEEGEGMGWKKQWGGVGAGLCQECAKLLRGITASAFMLFGQVARGGLRRTHTSPCPGGRPAESQANVSS